MGRVAPVKTFPMSLVRETGVFNQSRRTYLVSKGNSVIRSLSLRGAKLSALLLIGLSLVALGGCGGGSSPDQDLSRFKSGPTAEDVKAGEAATSGKPLGGAPPQAPK